MKCVLLGATRGVGLETLLNLIGKGHSCYALARSTASFDETLTQRGVIDRSLITVVKGDAFQETDIENLFETAGNDVEFVLFSLGMHLYLYYDFLLVTDPTIPCRWKTELREPPLSET